MNQFLGYLWDMQTHRRSPDHFVVVYEDYRWVEIKDIHEFNLAILRTSSIGVGIWMPAEGVNGMWRVNFEDPFGGTRTATVWKMRGAVDYISHWHNELMKAKMREIHLPVHAPNQIGVSDAGK